VTTAPPPHLEITRLAKQFAGGAGISDVAMTVPAGGITGFIGVNGAGKSTTLRCIVGLLTPDAGEIRLFGRPADAEGRRRIGFLPEERGLFPRDRARDVIAFYARLHGVARREAYAEADRLLERIGLGARRRDRIGDLSKGNAQRVQILCALAHRPELLILDEPFSGLDPIGQAEVMSLFAEYRAAGGAILFSTHAMAAAERLCDRIVMLAGGRTVFQGSVAEVSQKAPHGATVVTPDSEGLIEVARSLGGQAHPVSASLGDAACWRVLLPREITEPVLIRALATQGVSIHSFEPIKANLEGAFWDLAASASPKTETPSKTRHAA